MSILFPIPRGTREVHLTASAGQTVFGPINFLLYDALDVRITEKLDGAEYTLILDPADYAITPAAPAIAFPATFMITFAQGRTENSEIGVYGLRIPSRATDVTRGGALVSQSLERELDKQVATAQELRRDIDTGVGRIGDIESIAAHADLIAAQVAADRIATEEARDIAVNVVGANLVNIQSQVVAQTVAVPQLVRYLLTAAYQTLGDHGGGLYVRVASEPSHAAKFRTLDRFLPNGAIDLANGGWWELREGEPRPEQFGGVGDNVTNDTTAFNAALTFAIAAGADLVLDKSKTYLLSSWPALGYYPVGKTRIRGDGSSTLKGPATDAYFLRPGDAFTISGVKFDRWTGIVRRDTGEGGSITGARFTDNDCTNINGIPVNIEITCKDSYVSRNRFTSCSGGYVIRIGENTYGNQDNWSGNFITGNVMRSITATGATSLFAIIAHGRDTLIEGNDIDGLTSTNGEAVGIYVKLRFSQIINNRIRNVTSTGGSGAALDVAGISLKGAIRSVTNSGVQGYKIVCANNHVRSIGAQYAKGSGIRCQISDSIVIGNIVQDVGLVGISSDDSNGSSFNKIVNNSIEGFNILGTYGIQVSTFGSGIRVTGNSIKDFKESIQIACGSNTLLSTFVSGNSITSAIAASYGFVFSGGGAIAGVMITGNDVNLPASGYVVLNNVVVTRVNLRNNDFTPATSNGAGNLLGSATGITFTSNP